MKRIWFTILLILGSWATIAPLAGNAQPEIINSPRTNIGFGDKIEATDSTLLIVAARDTVGQRATGSVFAYAKTDIGWSSRGRLIIPISLDEPGFRFGRDIALAESDSSQFAIATLSDATDSHVLVYRYHQGEWTFIQELASSIVDLDAFEQTLVGSDLSGAISVLTVQEDTLAADTVLSESGYWLGSHLRISGDMIISSEWSFDPAPGKIASFFRTNTGWSSFNDVPTPNTTLASAKTSAAERTLAVQTGMSTISMYEFDGFSWIATGTVDLPEAGSFATNSDLVFASAPTDDTHGIDAGQVNVWKRGPQDWALYVKLHSPNPTPGERFGRLHPSIRGSSLFVSREAPEGGPVYAIPIAEIVGVDNQPRIEHALQVYPNPASSRIWVDGLEAGLEHTRASLIDVLGRRMATTDVVGNGPTLLEIDNITSGAYLLVVSSDQRILTSQIIHVVK